MSQEDNVKRTWPRTTSGKTEKLLFFKLRYLRRDKRANAMGRVASLLYPRAILGYQNKCQNKFKESLAGIILPEN